MLSCNWFKKLIPRQSESPQDGDVASGEGLIKLGVASQLHILATNTSRLDAVDIEQDLNNSKCGRPLEMASQSGRDFKRVRLDKYLDLGTIEGHTHEAPLYSPPGLALATSANRRTSHVPSALGHRPRNTLHSPSPVSHFTTQSIPSISEEEKSKRRFDNIRIPRWQDSSETYAEMNNSRAKDGQRSKRRRLNNEPLPRSSPGQPIDLTSDDEEVRLQHQITTNQGSHFRPISKGSQLSSRHSLDDHEFDDVGKYTESASFPHSSRRRDGYFDNHEYDVVGKYTESDGFQAKSKITKDSSASHYFRESSEPAVDGPPVSFSKQENQRISTASHPRPKVLSSSDLPHIDLERGMPTKVGPLVSSQPKQVERTGVIPSRESRLDQSPTFVKPSASSSGRQRGDWSHADDFLKQDYIKANDMFRRVEMDKPLSRKVKAKERMQASSKEKMHAYNGSMITLESDDELSGAPTVAKASACDTASNDPINNMGMKEHSQIDPQSPPKCRSDRTNKRYNADESKVAKAGRSKYFDEDQAISSDGSDQARIPIHALYSPFCVLEGDGIELVWVDDLQAFQVAYDEEFQMMPNRSQLYQIDKRAAQRWNGCRDSLRVQLKGSRTEFGNGQVLLHFKDESGLSGCLTLFLSATNDGMAINCSSSKDMHRIFSIQTQELRKSYSREQEKATKNKAVALLESDSHPRRVDVTADEEQVTSQLSQLNVSVLPWPEKVTPNDAQPSDISSWLPEARTDHAEDLVDYSRRSQRLLQTPVARSPSPEKWTRIHKPDPWNQPVVYPAAAPPRVTVNYSDLERLDEGEFINDSLVSFGLREIEENMDGRHKRDVHFFNTFFFSALSNKNGRTGLNYDAVKRWTRNKDLFATPYVVVPINVDLHWFVAIICNLPNLRRQLSGSDDGVQRRKQLSDTDETRDPSVEEETDAAQNIQVEDVIKVLPRSPDLEIDPNPAKPETSDASRNEAAEASNTKTASSADEDVSAVRMGTPGKIGKRKPVGRKYDVDEPVIITLDSLSNAHSIEIRYLKEYIKAEAKDKRAMEVETTQLAGITAKGIPLQSNYCDCGLYLIGYLEEFAKSPRKFVEKILRREMEPADFGDLNPSAMRARIRTTLLGLNQQHETERKAHKSAKRAARKQAKALAQANPESQSSPIQKRVAVEARNLPTSLQTEPPGVDCEQSGVSASPTAKEVLSKDVCSSYNDPTHDPLQPKLHEPPPEDRIEDKAILPTTCLVKATRPPDDEDEERHAGDSEPPTPEIPDSQETGRP